MTQQIGKFHILSHVASTPLLEAYKAKTVGIAGFEKTQLLLRIDSRICKERNFADAFVEEARNAFALNHRNIMQIYEFGQLEGDLFLAGEYVPGLLLSDMLPGHRTHPRDIPLPLCCYIVAEVAAGLDYAHRYKSAKGIAQPVVHADLAPYNIHCSFEGAVKIQHLGLSHAAYRTIELARRTTTPPRYMAPELWRKEPATPATDIFSVGAVLWELLYRRPLFAGNSIAQLRREILSCKKPPPPPSDAVPRRLVELLERCLQFEPADRLSDASKLQNELTQYQIEAEAPVGSRTVAALMRELGQPTERPDTIPPPNTRSRRIDLLDAATELAQPHAIPPSQRIQAVHSASVAIAPPPRAGLLDTAHAQDDPAATAALDQQRQRSLLKTTLLDNASATDSLRSRHRETVQEPLPGVAAAYPDQESGGAESAPTLRRLAERKRAVIVALELRGSKELRQAARELIRAAAHDAGEAVWQETEHDSWITAVFGVPLRRNDDLLEAIGFARDSIDAVASLSRDAQLPSNTLAARAGIRFGLARSSGAGETGTFEIIGSALADARALAQHGHWHHVLVAGIAARSANAGYLLEPFPTLSKYGKNLRCLRVVGARSAPLQPVATHAPLVGRANELAALKSKWEEANANCQQRTVIVVGDPGAGKSRLVEAFAAQCDENTLVLRALAQPANRSTPYSVAIGLISDLTGIARPYLGRYRQRAADKLAQRLGPGAAAQNITSWLMRILGDGDETLEEIPTSTQVISAMHSLLSMLSERSPVVCIVDDLASTDLSSIDLLSSIVGNPLTEGGGPLLLLVTLSADDTELLELLGSAPDTSIVALPDLSVEQRQEMIRQRLGPESTMQAVSAIERRSGGNPFLIDELCRAYREWNTIRNVPSSVEGLIGARIDQLSADIKSTIQHAAVLGQSFREGLLAAVLERNPTRWLAELRSRGFLQTSVRALAPLPTSGESERLERQWSFRHAVVRQVIYQSISAAERKSLHRRVGQLMARLRDRAEDPAAEIANHLVLGDCPTAAAPLYLQAVAEAGATGAIDEAITFASRAYQLCESDDLRYSALLARERLHGHAAMGQEQAADLAELKRLAFGDHERTAEVHAREAAFLLRAGKIYQALQTAEQAEAAALRASNDLLRGEALRLRGEAYARLDDRRRSLEAIERSLTAFERLGATLPAVRAKAALGRVHLQHAAYDQALSYYEGALADLQGLPPDQQQYERLIRNGLAIAQICRGNYTRALHEASLALKSCEALGDRLRAADNRAVAGIAHLHLGQLDRAAHLLLAARADHQQSDSRWNEADTLVYLALVDSARGDHERALLQLEQAQSIARRVGARSIVISSNNALALVLLRRGRQTDTERALTAARQAFGQAREQQLVTKEILGLSRAAWASRELGDTDGALALSRRSVELLGEQRYIDMPAEEIFYTHYRVMAAAGQHGSSAYLQQAWEHVKDKLKAIEAPTDQRSFLRDVPLNVAIASDLERTR